MPTFTKDVPCVLSVIIHYSCPGSSWLISDLSDPSYDINDRAHVKIHRTNYLIIKYWNTK